MNRKTFITLLLLFCSWSLSAQDIVIRNTCITKCAYCSDSTSVDSTVFEYARPVASSASAKFNWVFRKAGSDNSYSTILGNSDKRTGRFKFCEKGDYAVDLYLNGSVVYLKYKFKNSHSSINGAFFIGEISSFEDLIDRIEYKCLDIDIPFMNIWIRTILIPVIYQHCFKEYLLEIIL